MSSIQDDIQLLKDIEQNEMYYNENIKLLSYQESHAKNIIKILKENNTTLDSSDPGIGKTYIASAVCKQMNLRPIVICPKMLFLNGKLF
jgi:superfamily II DNA or RNA helicase